MPQKSTIKIPSLNTKNTQRDVKKKTEKKPNNGSYSPEKKPLYPDYVVKKKTFHDRTIQTYPERDVRKKPQAPVNSPNGPVGNYITTSMLIPDTEESLLKYLDWINKAREKEKQEKLMKEKRKTQNKFTLKNKKRDDTSNHNNVKKRVTQQKPFHPDQKVTSPKVPIVITMKHKQDRELQTKQRQNKRKSDFPWRPLVRRSPFRSPVRTVINKKHKTVSFIDQSAKRKHPYHSQPYRGSLNKFGPAKYSDIPGKNVSKQKKVRVTCKRHTRREISSPTLQQKSKSPPTEVSKWFPLSVNGHTKPYYEAWLDSEPSPAVFYPSNNDIFKVARDIATAPKWVENTWGTIRVRR